MNGNNTAVTMVVLLGIKKAAMEQGVYVYVPNSRSIGDFTQLLGLVLCFDGNGEGRLLGIHSLTGYYDTSVNVEGGVGCNLRL